MRIQGWHFVILLVVVLLVFGANRLPDLARSVGQSLRILKDETKALSDDGPPRPPGATPESGPDANGTPPTSSAAPQEPDPGPRG